MNKKVAFILIAVAQKKKTSWRNSEQLRHKNWPCMLNNFLIILSITLLLLLLMMFMLTDSLTTRARLQYFTPIKIFCSRWLNIIVTILSFFLLINYIFERIFYINILLWFLPEIYVLSITNITLSKHITDRMVPFWKA